MSEELTGWTAFVGATIFEVGSLFGLWEAWNRNDVVNFGWEIEKALHLDQDDRESESGNNAPDTIIEENPKHQKWIWWSTEGKYWYELGFLAAFAQFCAATIFWISG
jgi:hypothetical protein